MSSERSGSNLLRRLLANHPRVASTIAPHLLRTFYHNDLHYQKMPAGERALFEDIRTVVNHRKHHWNITLDFDEFASKFPTTCFLDQFAGFYSLMAEAQGASFVVCKENNLFDYAESLQSYFGDDALFIYLHRDPRDYAWSWMQVPFLHQDPLTAARAWSEEQRLCLDFMRRSPKPVLRVAYEELCTDVQNTMDHLLKQLALPREPACYSPNAHDGEREDTDFIFFKNLDKPVDPENIGKSTMGFDALTRFEIEQITQEMMRELGYHPEFRHSQSRAALARLARFLLFSNPARYKKQFHDQYSMELVQDWVDLHMRMRHKFDA